MAILQFTPSKVTRESLGFFIPSCGFRIPDSRYYIPDYSVWRIHGRGPGGGGGDTLTKSRVTRSLWWLIYSFTLRFLGVILLGVDKFLANHLHLRYQELVTHRRVVTYSVIFVWASSGAISFTRPWADRPIIYIFFGIIETLWGYLIVS